MPRLKKPVVSVKQLIAVYLRVSTDEQAESGLGIEAQRTRCTAMAIASGYDEEIRYYIDDGVSGTKDPAKRKACTEMLHDIEQGKVKAVIVSALDRLARKMKYVIALTEDFGTRNVAFVSCKEKFDTSTPQGQFVLHMFAALGELERGMISQRTSEALTEKGKIDGEKGGRLPYGYIRIFQLDKEGKPQAVGVDIDPEKAEHVRLIFQLRGQHHAMDAIAAVLNFKKITPPRGGNNWYASGVREILLNHDAYCGGNRGDSSRRWPVLLEL